MAGQTVSTQSASGSRTALGPRLSAARQRRLDALIDKSKEGTLAPKELRELESMLDSIDRQSFWMLASEVMRRRRIKNTVVERRPRRKRSA
jgi:hypothetical protein